MFSAKQKTNGEDYGKEIYERISVTAISSHFNTQGEIFNGQQLYPTRKYKTYNPQIQGAYRRCLTLQMANGKRGGFSCRACRYVFKPHRMASTNIT